MTYRGRNVSICQDTAMAPRSHASAALRAFKTSASYLGDRIRTTTPTASKSSNVSMTDDRNAACFLGDSVVRCAFSSTDTSVSSTDGGGISPASEGGRLSRSDITHTPRALTRKRFISTGNCGQRKPQVIHIHDSFDTVVNAVLQTEKAALGDPSLCCTIPGGASPERVRNLIRLPEGLGFTSPCRFRKPVSPPIHHLPCREIHGDDLGHVVVLKSVPVPVRPRLRPL